MIHLHKTDFGVLFNGDCLEKMKLIPDKSINLIVTDPPYLMSYKTSRRKNKEHKFCNQIANDTNNDSNRQMLKSYFNICKRIMKDNTSMYVFCSSSHVDFFKQELEKHFKINNMIIWVKNNHTSGDLKGAFGRQYEIIFLVSKGKSYFNGNRLTDIWNFDRVSGNKLVHQNQKPVELIKQCILKHSDENDVVFDGFSGSSTLALACLETNRKYICIEKDLDYYNLSIDRINDCIIRGINGY